MACSHWRGIRTNGLGGARRRGYLVVKTGEPGLASVEEIALFGIPHALRNEEQWGIAMMADRRENK